MPETDRIGRAQAIACWTRILGQQHVVMDGSSTEAAATATFATSQRVPVILRPGDRRELQECVRVAQTFGFPVYPVSSGKNWGYGSRVPATGGCALIELGRMNRILDFSEELAYVTVEPGVTQRQLREFLAERRSKLWIDATGASPESSLIGNTMERGFGHTPYGDHFANSCGLEVVLPDGEIIETGFARIPGACAAPVYRWGVGPVLDGLFSQSNLGIVTRMTVWLMPAPEYFQAFFFRCDEPDSLAPLIDALRPLRLAGVIRSSVHIGNDYKVLSGIRQYPWEEMGGVTPLPPERMPEFRARYNFGVWSGSGGLYGTPAQVREARRLIRQALRGRATKLQFLDDRMLALAGRFARLYQLATGWDLSRTLELARPVYGLMKGIPTDRALESCYWRKASKPPAAMDPDRDRCGLSWCAPVAPLDGAHCAKVAGMASEILLRHGFEPMISLTLVTERSVACVVSIGYDRAVPGEDERALACLQELLEAMHTGGYPCYRLGIQSMAGMRGSAAYQEMLEKIKRTLDPNGVLSPARYEVPAAPESDLARLAQSVESAEPVLAEQTTAP